jgi:hypothetical protein
MRARSMRAFGSPSSLAGEAWGGGWRASAVLAFMLVWHPAAHAQPARDALEISVLTFGPGEIYWQRYGHNAILVRDRLTASTVVYNYGIFDFDEENFLLNFALGRMQYRLAAHPLPETLAHYRAEGRWIVEQRLNLNAAQRVRLRDFLEWNARPENARYPYDYFTSNCSTRLRDAINLALAGSLQPQFEAQVMTLSYRGEVARLSAPDRWLMLGMDAGLGPAVDGALDRWQASFVPGHLMEGLREVRIDIGAERTLPLVRSETVLYRGVLPEPGAAPPDLRLPFLGLGLLLAGALVLLHLRRERVAARYAFSATAVLLTVVLGMGGMLLAGLWAFTAHWGAWGNPNLLLFNPLCLLLLPVWWGAARAGWLPDRRARNLVLAIAAGAALTLLLRLTPWLAQQNLHWILLVLPIHVALASVVIQPSRSP